MMNSLNNLDNLLRRIHINPFGDFSDLTIRQKNFVNAVSQIIQNNETLCEDNIRKRIRDTDLHCCFWGLWKKGVLVTNNSSRKDLISDRI